MIITKFVAEQKHFFLSLSLSLLSRLRNVIKIFRLSTSDTRDTKKEFSAGQIYKETKLKVELY